MSHQCFGWSVLNILVNPNMFAQILGICGMVFYLGLGFRFAIMLVPPLSNLLLPDCRQNDIHNTFPLHVIHNVIPNLFLRIPLSQLSTSATDLLGDGTILDSKCLTRGNGALVEKAREL